MSFDDEQLTNESEFIAFRDDPMYENNQCD